MKLIDSIKNEAIVADTVTADPSLIASEQNYSIDNITVLVQWTNEEGVFYNITAIPSLLLPVTKLSNNTALFTVSYNTMYNVSIDASRCGQTMSSTNVIQLHYGRKDITTRL